MFPFPFDGFEFTEYSCAVGTHSEFEMARYRLTLSISPELKHALDELNEATGVAGASFVGEIIEGNIAMILGIAEAARKAKAEPARALEIMQRSMFDALQDLSDAQMQLVDEQPKLRPFTRKPALPQEDSE